MSDSVKRLPIATLAVFISASALWSAPPIPFIASGIPVPEDELQAVGYVGGQRCTATLVEDSVVLTAAHCVCSRYRKGAPTTCAETASFTLPAVFVTESDLGVPTNNGGARKRWPVTMQGTVSVHPKYGAKNASFDFAVVQLNQPASELVDEVPPIPIEKATVRPRAGDRLTIVGFGATGVGCDQKQIGKLSTSLRVKKIRKGNATIVLTNQPGSGACPGDSGGPALSSSGRVVGVASTVSNVRTGTESRYDPTYLAADWIETHWTVVPRRSIDFGETAQKDRKSQPLLLENKTRRTVKLTILASKPPPAGQPLSGFHWGALKKTLAPGENTRLQVEFAPRAKARFRSTLRIQRDPGGAFDVRLLGRGQPASVHEGPGRPPFERPPEPN